MAISPDGVLVAVGRWTGERCTQNDCTIYLFDRASGELRRSISGLPDVISHLAFSAESGG
jgi:hypothetical protein